MDPECIRQYDDLVEKKLVSRFNGYAVVGELQNPLLFKYGFDPFQFMNGARLSFREVVRGINSHDFIYYSNGLDTELKSAEFLRYILDPFTFEICKRRATGLKVGAFEMHIKDVIIHSAELYTLETRIVDDDLEEADNRDDWLTSWVKYYILSFRSNKLPSKIKFPVDEVPVVRHPVDSVIATVVVDFNVEETYAYAKVSNKNENENENGKETPKDLDQETVRYVKANAVFEACISGHVDLSWRITGLSIQCVKWEDSSGK